MEGLQAADVVESVAKAAVAEEHVDVAKESVEVAEEQVEVIVAVETLEAAVVMQVVEAAQGVANESHAAQAAAHAVA